MSIGYEIVPWALPREEIPFRVTWPEGFDFDVIEIKVPEGMEIIEILNVKEFVIEKNVANVFEIINVSGVTNYFGCVVATLDIFKELKITKKIQVNFMKNKKSVYKVDINARLFRPLLEVKKAPRKIVFIEGKKQELPLVLKYTGFGDITIKLDGKIRGKIVTRGKSFTYELLKRLLEMSSMTDVIKRDDKKEVIIVSPEFIQKMTKEILEILDNPPEEFESISKELIENINNTDYAEAIEEIMYDRIHSIVLSMLIDVLERNPAGNIKLDAGETSVSTVLTAPITTIELCLNYSDVLDNEYPEVCIPINIETKVSSGKKAYVDIPITIERWEIEPFYNVKEMDIG